MNFEIDGFEIIEKIGQGGMASVWKARQISLDRIVAIKVLSEIFSDDPDDIRRFQEEAQAAAKLKHPGIVQVHDAKAENGIYYFIMEYVSGYTVGDWLRRKGVLSEKDALLVADCVADALEYAWNHAKIVHCDIKPDNIIIDEDGTVKVADLGLARTISLMEADAQMLDEIMGTPAYISPEQAQGETNLDFRADVYSLGAMLYHLVTGKMMFEEFDDDEKLERHITDTVDDPIDINPHLSKGICWLIERMTAKDPDLREDSWGAVRADIKRVLHGHLPQGSLLPEGASTVCRSARRTVADYDHIAAMQIRQRRSERMSLVRTTLVAAVVAVAIAAAIKVYMRHASVNLKQEQVPVAETNVVDDSVAVSAENLVEPESNSSGNGAIGSPESQVVDSRNSQAQEMYEFAEAWLSDHPREYAAAIEQFRTVEKETRGTKYSLMAKQKIRELEQDKQAAIRKVSKVMSRKVREMVDRKDFDGAIRTVKNYNGPFASETREVRRKVVADLQDKKKLWLRQQHQRSLELNRERQRLIDSFVMTVLADDLNLAIDRINSMISNPAFNTDVSQLKEIKNVLEKAQSIDSRILDSFKKQYGETVDVYLKKGMRTLTIRDVSGDRIECRQQLSVGHGAVSIIKIGVGDLSDYERLRRMGDDSEYDVALVKGIMAFQSNAYSHAEKYFKMTQPLLGKYLLAGLRGGSSIESEPDHGYQEGGTDSEDNGFNGVDSADAADFDGLSDEVDEGGPNGGQLSLHPPRRHPAGLNRIKDNRRRIMRKLEHEW